MCGAPGRESAARDRPIDTCVHGRRLWYAREPRTESVCVCFVRFLRHVDTVADIIEPKTRARQLCLTGTGASGRLRTVQRRRDGTGRAWAFRGSTADRPYLASPKRKAKNRIN